MGTLDYLNNLNDNTQALAKGLKKASAIVVTAASTIPCFADPIPKSAAHFEESHGISEQKHGSSAISEILCQLGQELEQSLFVFEARIESIDNNSVFIKVFAENDEEILIERSKSEFNFKIFSKQSIKVHGIKRNNREFLRFLTLDNKMTQEENIALNNILESFQKS